MDYILAWIISLLNKFFQKKVKDDEKTEADIKNAQNPANSSESATISSLRDGTF